VYVHNNNNYDEKMVGFSGQTEQAPANLENNYANNLE